MIRPIILPEEQTNKYFLHHQRLAKVWEKYAENNGGVIKGQVNIYLLEFVLRLNRNDYSVIIQGLRNQKNVQGGLQVDGIHLTKTTRIEISPSVFGDKYWKVYRSSVIKNLFHGLTGRVERLRFNDEFKVHSRSIVGRSESFSKMQFEALNSIPKLAYIKNNQSKLVIHFYELLSVDVVDLLLNKLLK